MPKPSAPKSAEPSRKRLTEIFRALGEVDPEGLASHGPQSIARFLFLKGLWRSIVDENDERWQKQWGESDPIGGAIERLAEGASRSDLTMVVRQMQILAVYNAVQLLDHCAHGIEDLQAKVPENVEWRLVTYDGEAETVGSRFGELHGAFLRLDPTGRTGDAPPVAARGQKSKRTKKARGKGRAPRRRIARDSADEKRAR